MPQILYSSKELNRQRNKRYREKHHEAIAERHKQWLLDNPEKRNAHTAKFRSKNVERLRAERREWRKANPEKAKELVRKYQARKMGATAEKIDYDEVKRLSNMICGICGEKIVGEYQFDHIIPLSRGGPHTQDNLQLAHPFCNQSKGNNVASQEMRKEQSGEATVLF